MMSHSNYLFFLPLSSFPFLSSLSFFNIILGIFISLKFNFFLLWLSTISCFFIGLIWWFCYSLEFFEEGLFSFNMSNGLKYSFILFISSEIFFFFSFFWSYFHFFLSPLMDFNFCWPPYSIIMFDFLDIPLLNTFLLLSSGITITCSHYFFVKNKVFFLFFYLFLTFCLGLIFSFFQFFEYSNSFFSYNDSCFGSCFYILTGFHGLHVVVGSLYLIFVFVRNFSYFSHFQTVSLSFELSSWYWHFVDVVWIFLYFFVYVYSCF